MPEFFNHKIQQELNVIQAFREEYADFPKGKLEKTESPDFILKMGTRSSLGIELTRIKPGNDEKVSYEDQDIILNRESIEHTIETKEEKLPLYRRRKLVEIWLLISIDLATASPDYHINNKLQNWSFHSGFDRIFLFDESAPAVFELALAG